MSRPDCYSRASYEGPGGWRDGRLGMAYDLLQSVLTEAREDRNESDAAALLSDIQRDIEEADERLGG